MHLKSKFFCKSVKSHIPHTHTHAHPEKDREREEILERKHQHVSSGYR